MKTNQEQNDTQKEAKQVYEKPEITVIEMEMEGILCQSGNNFKPGGGGGKW